MRFLCIDCDEVMGFAERQLPGDGTMAAVYICGECGREMALLTNPMETRLVSSMGVKVGGRSVPEQPMELTRSNLDGARPEAFEVVDGEENGQGITDSISKRDEAGTPGTEAWQPAPDRVVWSEEATARLQRVPSFVRGMVKRIYTDWARDREIETITPEVMDRARTDLGLEGM